MKRIKQLQVLSKEHHLSLSLAKKCKCFLVKETDDVINEFCQQLKSDFDTKWLKHFEIEELAIFNVANEKTAEISELCDELKNEHLIMLNMVNKISAGEYQLLAAFGQLLHDHTRKEERQLFPLVENLFTLDELDNILKIEIRKI